MIAPLMLSALLGTWRCTSPDAPGARFAYSFFRNGTGSIALLDARGRVRATISRFTYAPDAGDLLYRWKDAVTTLHRIDASGTRFRDLGYSWWHDGTWAAPPTQSRYDCTRE